MGEKVVILKAQNGYILSTTVYMTSYEYVFDEFPKLVEKLAELFGEKVGA